MARKISFEFSGCNQTLTEIDSTYKKILSSLHCKFSKRLNMEFDKMFFGLSEKEVNEECAMLSKEVEYETILAMLASVESVLRIDFISRCQLKKTDKLSLFYRSGYDPSKRIYKYSFSDVVMKGWKDYLPEQKMYIDQMNELYQLRHWLAHGRYWILPQNLSQLDYLSVYSRCNCFLSAISGKLIV